MIAQTEGGQGTYSKLRGGVRKVGMGPFRNSIKAAGRRAVSHVRAARRVLARARRRRVQAHLFDAPSPMAVLVRDVSSMSTEVRQELAVGSPSAVPARAKRATSGEYASGWVSGRMAAGRRGRCLGGWGWRWSDAHAGVAGGNGRACHVTHVGSGGNSPGSEVSLLAACPVTS